MIIACSKKLAEELEIKPLAGEPDSNPFFRWSANVVTINRRKAVVAVCDSNRFGFVLYGMKIKDFDHFSSIFLDELRATLLRYGIRPELVERYVPHDSEVHYIKLSDKRSIARMNRAVMLSENFYDELTPGSLSQPNVTSKINEDFVSGFGKDFNYPYRLFFSDFRQSYGDNIFSVKAVDLTVTLDLQRYTAWRRLLIPDCFTFERVHQVLQVAFGWRNRHLYEFEIFSRQQGHLRLVADSEELYSFDANEKTLFAAEKVLSDCIGSCEGFTYTYDMGDFWEHAIKVNGIVDNYDKNFPVCIMGEGNAPPEDVGGVGGYMEYLDILANPEHPDYQALENWSIMQWYEDFSIEYINRRLGYIVIGSIEKVY
ncbi:plasmid pRiA4b ORF-3 family protein [Acetanaerobacterium elongatum]|uniref:PRiA4b ORF-3-like protein n=1 Tax=Acetanaerobacterium elongatum TaxID=258515 RepID=A0A1H0DZ84_9FIRM|nr:plasmid pRiA4b ORF-3 family protein [Acetanaerobacterium elongatum]SDN75291.1 pRiA4b ORF-3-like protein [Acetanaerobacterium elongatum]